MAEPARIPCEPCGLENVDGKWGLKMMRESGAGFTERQTVTIARPARWARGPRTVGAFVPKLTKKAFEKYGFPAAALLTDWAAIVGPELASFTQPEKLKWPRGARGKAADFGESASQEPIDGAATLVLRADGPCSIEVQQQAGLIIERINRYFGYRAVRDLRVIQAPIVRLKAVTQHADVGLDSRKAKPRDVVQTRSTIANVRDPLLKGALERMSQGIGARLASRGA